MNKTENIHTKSKYIIDAVLISMVLFIELCFNGTALFITPIIFLSRIVLCKKINWDNSIFWLILMMIYTTLLGMIVPHNTEDFSMWYNFAVFLNLIFICILINRYSTIRQVIEVLKITIILSTLLNGLYIMSYEYKVIISRLPDYMTGKCGYRIGVNMGVNPNNIAWLFGLLALLTIYFFIGEKEKKFIFLYIFQLAIIFFTGSKNGLLIAIIPIFYYGIKSIKKLNIKILIIILISLIVLWNMIQKIPILYTLVGERIDQFLFTLGFKQNLMSVGTDVDSTLKRVNMLKKATQMFWEKPILGWGIGAFARYSGYGYYCHNNYMELLVSGGIIGFIIYYGYIGIRILKTCVSYKTEYKDLIYILIISIFIIDMGTVNFYSRIPFYFRTIIMFIVSSKMRKTELPV